MTVVVQLTLFALAAVVGAASLWWWQRCVIAPADGDDNDDASARLALDRLLQLAECAAGDVCPTTDSLRRELALATDPAERATLEAVAQVLETQQRMRSELDQAEQRLQVQARQLESQAQEVRTDPLTQLANRRAFEDELKARHDELHKNSQPTSLIIFDIDHFKKMNDQFGHLAGDEVLRGVARVIRQKVGGEGVTARYGGEEFAVVLPAKTLPAARETAEMLRRAVSSARFHHAGTELRVTSSFGVAELSIGESQSHLVRRADEALYVSKRNGRNCVHYHDGEKIHRSQTAVDAKPVGAEEIQRFLGPPANASTSTMEHPAAAGVNQTQFLDQMVGCMRLLRSGADTHLSMVLFEIHGLHRITKEQGPEASAVLRRVAAQLIKASLREIDQVTRLGDDLFMVMLAGKKLSDAQELATSISRQTESRLLPGKAAAARLRLTCGVVEAGEHDDLPMILSRAREALERARRLGPGGVYLLDSSGHPPTPVRARS